MINKATPPRRQDKIPSLSKPLKDEVCRRLHDGERGVDIIAWLHAQPEVTFNIRPQNLSKFKQGPYYRQWTADYLKAEQRAQELQAVNRVARRIVEEDGGKASQASAAIVSGTLLAMVDAFSGFDPTDAESLKTAHEFLKMLDRVRARDIAASRLDLERRKVEQDQEKINLAKDRLKLEFDKWERMAAEAVLDKATSAEVQAIVGGSQSSEEKIDQVRHLLFGNYKPFIPEYVE